MAIYHLEAKIISRGTGRSACAAAAYMSCSRIYNNYDGIQHDYTRQAPSEWQALLTDYIQEIFSLDGGDNNIPFWKMDAKKRNCVLLMFKLQ